eukprot:scaffold182119_cov18-Tisochrysis_lutea.AAC.1
MDEDSFIRVAETQLYLATSPDVANITGKYFDNCKEVKSDGPSYDKETAKKLWEVKHLRASQQQHATIKKRSITIFWVLAGLRVGFMLTLFSMLTNHYNETFHSGQNILAATILLAAMT